MFPALETIREDDLESLAMLDAGGLLIAPGEDFDSFLCRISGLLAFREKVEQELAQDQTFKLEEGFDLPADKRIAPEILEEAAAITEPLYAISVRWVPGFFLSKSLGFLWGGCSYTDTDSNLNVFLIRGSFARKKRWFIYRRDELTAHELCHAARSAMRDDTYEEYFAYQTSPFRGRRYLGGCFRTRFDALFFLAPVLLLLVAELGRTFLFHNAYPIWPFWMFAGLFPAFLLVRNQLERNRLKRAAKLLKEAGVRNPPAILFRCVTEEIKRFARLNSGYEAKVRIDELARQELRWRLIKYRFVEEQHDEYD
jgi:hypothetical protein